MGATNENYVNDLKPESKVVIAEDECLQCGACASVCATGAIKDPDADHAAFWVNDAECAGCLSCVDACPAGACKEA